MQYIVLDLEWNQALTRDSIHNIHNSGFLLAGEIIQFGAVRLNEQWEVVDTFREIVAPKYYKKMHWSVRKLTGISTESLAHGLAFADAYREFTAFCGSDYAILTWGPDDMPMLRSNLRLHELPLPKNIPAYDLQKIFSRRITCDKRQWSLADALEKLEITDIYPPHDALNDALNTAKICAHLPLPEAFEHYSDPEPQKTPESESALSEVRQSYESFEAFQKQGREVTLPCPGCGGTLRFERWVRRVPGKRKAGCICACGSAFMLRQKWKSVPETGELTVVSLLFPAEAEQVEALKEASYSRHRPRRRPSSVQNPPAGPDTGASE